jgi:hypothetical protein
VLDDVYDNPEVEALEELFFWPGVGCSVEEFREQLRLVLYAERVRALSEITRMVIPLDSEGRPDFDGVMADLQAAITILKWKPSA